MGLALRSLLSWSISSFVEKIMNGGGGPLLSLVDLQSMLLLTVSSTFVPSWRLMNLFPLSSTSPTRSSWLSPSGCSLEQSDFTLHTLSSERFMQQLKLTDTVTLFLSFHFPVRRLSSVL